MSSEIDYAALLRSSTLALVREVLAGVERDGIPGEHHFYLTFRTDAPGVDIPPKLRREYQETMTIVLQNQFWELEVEQEEFAVTLRFGGELCRLEIPFEALTAFLDPSVPFGLDFTQFSAAALSEAVAGENDESADAPGGDRNGDPSNASEDGGDVLPFRPREPES